MSQYDHTQRSPMHLLLMAVAGVLVGQAFLAQQEQSARVVLLCVAALFIFLAACFAELTVRDAAHRR